MSTEPSYRMDRPIQPGEFQMSSLGAIRGDLAATPSPGPARISGERAIARISGELRVARTSGSSRVLADDERSIPLLRNADGVTASRISGAFAAGRVVPRSRSAVANRVLNIAIAVIAIAVLAPVFIIVALLVRLTSPGPILYTQTRVGIDRRSRRALALYDRRARDAGGSVFTMYKFRSMFVDAERMSGAVWATPNDPRATPVGQYPAQDAPR